MRGADYEPPGEYEGMSPRTLMSEMDGEHYNLQDVKLGGGWPSDPRSIRARCADVLARAAIQLAFCVIAFVALFLVFRIIS